MYLHVSKIYLPMYKRTLYIFASTETHIIPGLLIIYHVSPTPYCSPFARMFGQFMVLCLFCGRFGRFTKSRLQDCLLPRDCGLHAACFGFFFCKGVQEWTWSFPELCYQSLVTGLGSLESDIKT